MNYLVNQQYTGSAKTASLNLYSNYDALNNGLQPIIATSNTLLNNCQYPNYNSDCWYVYNVGGGSGGTFTLHFLSDTSIRVSFRPSSNMDFGTDVYYDHYFKLQFHGFSFGSSCSISSVIA